MYHKYVCSLKIYQFHGVFMNIQVVINMYIFATIFQIADLVLNVAPPRDLIGRYSCCICGELFSAAYSVKRHIQSIHQKLRFNCGICGKSFCQKAHLTHHLRKDHPTDINEDSHNANNSEPELHDANHSEPELQSCNKNW